MYGITSTLQAGHKIIREVKERAGWVRVGGRLIHSLFFADGGLLLANGVEEARETVEVLRDAAG